MFLLLIEVYGATAGKNNLEETIQMNIFTNQCLLNRFMENDRFILYLGLSILITLSFSFVHYSPDF